MDSDQLKCVIERLNSQDVLENVRIGLANVHQRIQLIYGNEYGVIIQSEQNIGTCV